MSTKIRTPKMEEVTIPNTVLVSEVTKNYSRLAADHGVVLHTPVTIGYDVPWRQVEALLLMAADRTPALSKAPHPYVFRKHLKDFYVEYQLNAYLVDPRQQLWVLSELHTNVLDVFNEYGVQIMVPHYLADPSGPKVVASSAWYASPARPPASTSGETTTNGDVPDTADPVGGISGA
jgi:small-conductance mechanosensitive channel